MHYYRIYVVNGVGGFETAEWLEAENDDEALKTAFERGDGRMCEVWERNRFVGSIPNRSGRREAKPSRPIHTNSDPGEALPPLSD